MLDCVCIAQEQDSTVCTGCGEELGAVSPGLITREEILEPAGRV